MSHLIEAPPYRSPEWHEWRRHGLGASELPTVLGLDPYRGEYELALVKRGEAPDFEGNAATRWGHRIEAVALDAYAETQGVEIVRGETWGDERHPHLWASLDGRTESIGIEVKATTRWVTPPDKVRVQALAQAGIAGLDRIDVVRVSPYGEPIITTIERDEALIEDILAAGDAWWARYGAGDELPPPDGSRAAMRHLDRLRGEDEREATAEQATLAGTLRAIRHRRDELESQERAVISALKASMAGTGLLTGEGWRIAWRAVKGRVTTDWRSVAAEYRLRITAWESTLNAEWDAERDLGGIERKHTTTGEPGTQFVPRFEEERT